MEYCKMGDIQNEDMKKRIKMQNIYKILLADAKKTKDYLCIVCKIYIKKGQINEEHYFFDFVKSVKLIESHFFEAEQLRCYFYKITWRRFWKFW